jgi:protein-L-isoaspartate(D-aspartate) O-methyltransferase
MSAIEFTTARHNMVESQIRTNKVRDHRLLDALDEVPREAFVPQERRGVAYNDEDLPLAAGRYLMEPMILARLIQAAEVTPGDLVLDAASGSGYSAAILSHMGATVVALEPDEGLAARSSEALGELGLDSVVVVKGDLREGYAKQAPYNAVLLAAAVSEVPQALLDQLGEGGRLVTVLRQDAQTPGQAALFRKAGGVVSHRSLFDANTPVLPGFKKAKGFVF